MRRVLVLAVLAAGCGAEPTKEERQMAHASTSTSSGASAAADYGDLEPYSGQIVTLTGTFQHDRAIHGVVVLDRGPRIVIPHFDQFAHGDDWLKFVGHRCWATGRLHTWTKNIPGYHGPTLEITDFTGKIDD